MSDQSDNRQNLPSHAGQTSIAATLYHTYPAQRAKVSMIATPIGNLGDLSERVVDALFAVDELWCEDTRRTLALLQAILKEHPERANAELPKLKRLDQHTTEKEIRKMLEQVAVTGQWIGVVTDAGTPGVSDPGGLVTALVTHYPLIRLEPVPGPSAVSAMTSIAGFEENSFVFRGFFPRSESETIELLNALKDAGITRNWIFFESPNRIQDTIKALRKWSESQEFDADFVFAKELTKLHESIWRGRGRKFFDLLNSKDLDTRGEWVVAVILPKSYVRTEKSESSWELALECLIQAEISPKAATTIVVQRFSVAKNLAYKVALEIQKKMQFKDSKA
ncbi:MAG: 16S rRNA (cytidine(1402)-2'-O)-methyltransferase [Bdellovibrionales bacterium]|nr:16S rRNA (cytidine(1402)-2'-O)-methyltransferase [Bdellovibrionales bacterium]